jgi:hypothetical protein
MHERMKIARLLWGSNISAEYSHLDNPRFKRQMEESLDRKIPFMAIIGTDEVAKGTVKVKSMRDHTEVEVPLAEMVQTLMAQGCSVIPAGADTTFMDALKDLSMSAIENGNASETPGATA